MGKRNKAKKRKRAHCEPEPLVPPASVERACRSTLPPHVIAQILEPRPPQYERPGPRHRSVQLLVAPGDHSRMKRLSIYTHTSLQQLGRAAWNAYLISLGLPELEPISWATVPDAETPPPTRGSGRRPPPNLP